MVDEKYYFIGYKDGAAGSDAVHATEENAMIFMAKDNAVPGMLRSYREECIRLCCTPEHINRVDGLIERVERYRDKHRELCKVPD